MVTEKNIREPKIKLKQRGRNAEIKNTPAYRVNGNPNVTLSEIMMRNSGHTSEPDRYEWIYGRFFLRHRPGVSKTEFIELRDFQ